MAITVDTQPGTLGLVRNPIAIEVSSDALYSTTGFNSLSELNFAGTPPCSAGEVIDFVFGDDITFTIEFVAGTPDGSGNQWPAYVSGTTTGYLDSLLPYARANAYLDKHYTVVRSSTKLAFTARESGNKWKMDANSTTDVVDLTITSTAFNCDFVLNENMEIVCRVWMEDSWGANTYTLVAEVGARLDASGNARHDIAEILRAYVNSFPVPSLSASTIVRTRNYSTKKYKIQLMELYGSTPTYKKMTEITTLFAQYGGIQHQRFAVIGDLFAAFNTVNDWPLFSNRPLVRYVTEAQPEWILFYRAQGIDYQVRIELTYTDGTTTSVSPIALTADRYEASWIPTGYIQRDIAASITSGKTLDYWKVWVDDPLDDSTISQVVTYKLVEADYLDRFIVYTGSLGNFETLRATGVQVQSAKFSGETFDKFFEFDYATTEHLTRQLNAEYRESYELFTGYKSKDQLLALRELLLAEYRWMVIDDALVPIQIEFDEHVLINDDNGEYLYGLNLKVYTAFVERNYSVI